MLKSMQQNTGNTASNKDRHFLSNKKFAGDSSRIKKKGKQPDSMFMENRWVPQ